MQIGLWLPPCRQGSSSPKVLCTGHLAGGPALASGPLGTAQGCAGTWKLGDETRSEGFGCKAFWAAALVPGGPRLLIATGEVLGCCCCPGAEAALGVFCL